MAKIVDTIEGLGIPAPAILIVALSVAFGVLYQMDSSYFFTISSVILKSSPVWLPLIALMVFWRLWLVYIRARFFKSQKNILLEIRLPREIHKSPLAMEAVLSGMHQGSGETTFIDRYWFGKTRTWFSLEIVSIDGNVRFFIWTKKFFKNIVEAQIYAQYPEIEILEVDDYTKGVFFDVATTSVWGCDMKLARPDPYPIKTYIDYGLDKETKEELKIDPLANLIEFFGNIGPGHQLWFQIIIRVNKSERRKPGTWFGTRGWKDDAKDEVDKIRKEATQTLSDEGSPMLLLTPGQQDMLKALERSITKLGFDCGIRGIYIADRDKFNPTNIVGLLGSIKQFNSNTLNRFTPTRWLIDFNYPWQDWKQIRQNRSRHLLIEAYKRRSWFFEPFKTPYFVLNTEELATIFHFPGGVLQTPTVARVPSKRAEAPSNLPT